MSCHFRTTTALLAGPLVARTPFCGNAAGQLLKGHMIEIDQSLHASELEWQDEQLPKTNSQRVSEADNWETGGCEVKFWC